MEAAAVRRWLPAVFVAIGALAALRGASGQQQAPIPPWPQTIEKVKEGLFVIPGFGGPSGGNIAVRVTTEGVILVDDKYPQDFSNIVERVRSVTTQPVKYVLNTHQHGDHTGSNADFLKSAEIIAHSNARANMVKLKQPGLPRIVFTDQTAVFLGGVEVQAIHLGSGHTNGDAIIYFPDLKTIHTGDLIVGWAQRPDGRGNFTPLTPFIDYANGGNVNGWIQTLDNVLKLDFDTAIIGHGPVVKKEAIAEFRQRMQTLRDRMTSAVKGGVTRDDVVTRLKLDDLWPFQPPALQSIYDEMAKRATQ
jgi:glyoxylase-like metal-dependent hydrolase (beta-lactamase superfamily II)